MANYREQPALARCRFKADAAVGQATPNVQMQGQNFGTNQPTVTFSLGSAQVSSYTDTRIVVTATANVAGTGSFTVTSKGYSGQQFEPNNGGSAQATSPNVTASNPPLPQITGVSSTPFVAGQTYQNVVVTGTNFGSGSACPASVKISGAETSQFLVSVATCTPTSFEGTVTMDWAAASGSLVVTTAGGTATYALQIAAVNMQLTQVGAIAISSDGKYSEIATIKLAAVRSDNGAAITNFTGTVDIAEDGTTIYTQNQTTSGLPAQVTISSNGTVNFTAASLAGPNAALTAGPSPAQLKTTNFPIYGGKDFPVAQWVHTGAVLDGHASGAVPDWVQARTRDIFANGTGNGNSVANNKAVLATVSTYSAVYISNAQGDAAPTHLTQSPIRINPFSTFMRLDSNSGSQNCGTTQSKSFTNTFYHEARHAYQFSQAAIAGNDQDMDWAVTNNVSIAPTSIFADTTASRTVCHELANPQTMPQQSFLGPTIPDSFTNVDYALEEDASVFAQN